MSIRIAAQLYTVREYCKDERGFINTMKAVKAMGYEGVQLSGVSAQITPAETRRILDGEGLEAVVTHRPFAAMKSDLQTLVDEHHALGCRYMAIGGFFPAAEDQWNTEFWNQFIEEYNQVVDALEGTEITLGYHNHSHEFAKVTPRQIAYDMLLNKLDSRSWFELDTYWVAHGGANPAEYIRKVAGRIPVIHFKDLAINPKREHYITEIGNGNLNWFEILSACKYSRVKWIAVERDNGNVEALESLRRSRVYIKDVLGL